MREKSKIFFRVKSSIESSRQFSHLFKFLLFVKVREISAGANCFLRRLKNLLSLERLYYVDEKLGSGARAPSSGG